MHAEITCLNGQFLPSSEARIPVSDRGFRFGDGVFESIRVSQGVPYQWKLHLARLLAGLKALMIAPPAIDWQQMARTLIQKNEAKEGFLRIAISRGDGSLGYLPLAGITPTWLIEFLTPRLLPQQPCRLWLSRYARPLPVTMPTECKLAQGLTSTLALLEAQQHNCDEALLLNSRGELCSAAAANIFWIKHDEIFTPPLDTGCIDGTTRHAVMRLAALPVKEAIANIETLLQADGVFLSNSRFGIWPVRALAQPSTYWNTELSHIMELSKKLIADYEQYNLENSAYWNSDS